MKKIAHMFVLFILVVYSPAWFAEETITGLEIMDKVKNRDAGDDFKALAELIIVSSSGSEKNRKFLLFRKDYGDDSKSLFKFVEPQELKNSGLLIHTFANENNLQWLYLSGSRKKDARKIPEANKDGSFMGSEFYYVDFEENQPKNFDNKLLREEPFESYSTYVVESAPKIEDYPYSKVVSWVDKNTYIVVKADAYKKGELLKTITLTKLQKIDNIDTAMESVVINHKNGKKSVMKTDKVKYNTNLSDSMFTTNKLLEDL